MKGHCLITHEDYIDTHECPDGVVTMCPKECKKKNWYFPKLILGGPKHVQNYKTVDKVQLS